MQQCSLAAQIALSKPLLEPCGTLAANDELPPEVLLIRVTSVPMEKEDYKWVANSYTCKIRIPKIDSSSAEHSSTKNDLGRISRHSLVVSGLNENGSRTQVEANFVYHSGHGYQIWEAHDDGNGPTHDIELQLYSNGNLIALDDNGSRFYSFMSGAGVVLFNDIKILQASPPPNQQQGKGLLLGVNLANIEFEKRVVAHVSADGWRSVSIVPLSFRRNQDIGCGACSSPNQSGVEYWETEIALLPAIVEDGMQQHKVIAEVAFGLTTSSGMEHWDNNNGSNYRFEYPSGVLLSELHYS